METSIGVSERGKIMFNFLSRHRKLIVFIVGVIVNALVVWFANNPEATQYINWIIILLTGLGVYQASNKPIEE